MEQNISESAEVKRLAKLCQSRNFSPPDLRISIALSADRNGWDVEELKQAIEKTNASEDALLKQR